MIRTRRAAPRTDAGAKEPAMAKRRRSSTISRRRFLADSVTGAAAAAVFGRAPAVLAQQTRELQVWHTEVEPQTVKTIQDTSIAEFE
jgi:hypothetical protein